MPAILCVNNYHYVRGGAEMVYFAHQALMERLGWRTACFAMQHPENVPSPWSPWFVDEIEFGRDYGASGTLARAAKVIWSFEARRKLDDLLTRFTPDLAHLHNIYHHLSPAILPLLKSRGIPTVLTAHDLKLACPSYRMLAGGRVCERCRGGNFLHAVTQRCVKDSLAASALVALESAVHALLGTWKQVDKVAVPSRFYLDRLKDWGWPAHKLAYVPNWLDVDDFAPGREVGDYFLYAGRLSSEKGLATLIEAAARARMHLKIAGSGPMAQAVRELAAQGRGQVEFLGHLGGAQLQALVRTARAVVLPSEWYENAPMSVLEAHASGKPVLASDIGGLPELVHEGQTGWLFPPGDAARLAELMQGVAAMPASQLLAMGSDCRDRVAERFSRGAHLNALLATYREVLGKEPMPLAAIRPGPGATP